MTRIATYCHQGRDMKGLTDNAARRAVMADVAGEIAARRDWRGLDAVVFPGGFLSEPPGRTAKAFINKLARHSPGVQLVVGVDNIYGEQLALAFNSQGLSGGARKIFPVGEDVDAKTMPPITLHETDFATPSRFIKLRRGAMALLCVCYDMFGLTDAVRGETKRLAKATFAKDSAGRVFTDRKEMQPLLQKSFARHRELIARYKPEVALATIHRFKGPGRDSFWQRHGIASASAALRGGFAVAAAHYMNGLPGPDAIPLAAAGVPSSHLESGAHRPARGLQPEKYLPLEGGLLRLYSR
jgi:hypothetical protein